MDQIPELHSPLSPISESPSSPAYSSGKLAGGWAMSYGLFLHQQFIEFPWVPGNGHEMGSQHEPEDEGSRWRCGVGPGLEAVACTQATVLGLCRQSSHCDCLSKDPTSASLGPGASLDQANPGLYALLFVV